MPSRVAVIGLYRLVHTHTECFGNALAIGFVAKVAVTDMTVFDKIQGIAHCRCGIIKQGLLLRVVHQIEQRAWLAKIVIVIFTKIKNSSVSVNL